MRMNGYCHATHASKIELGASRRDMVYVHDLAYLRNAAGEHAVLHNDVHCCRPEEAPTA